MIRIRVVNGYIWRQVDRGGRSQCTAVSEEAWNCVSILGWWEVISQWLFYADPIDEQSRVYAPTRSLIDSWDSTVFSLAIGQDAPGLQHYWENIGYQSARTEAGHARQVEEEFQQHRDESLMWFMSCIGMRHYTANMLLESNKNNCCQQQHRIMSGVVNNSAIMMLLAGALPSKCAAGEICSFECSQQQQSANWPVHSTATARHCQLSETTAFMKTTII